MASQSYGQVIMLRQDGRHRSSPRELPRFSSFLSPMTKYITEGRLSLFTSSFLLFVFFLKRKNMNTIRNSLPPRPNPPPVGSGSSASGPTKHQCRRRKEKRRRLRKASPYIVVFVASHHLLPWTIRMLYEMYSHIPELIILTTSKFS